MAKKTAVAERRDRPEGNAMSDETEAELDERLLRSAEREMGIRATAPPTGREAGLGLREGIDLRVTLEREAEDGSWGIDIHLPDGQRLLTAGSSISNAITNAVESWPELRAALARDESPLDVAWAEAEAAAAAWAQGANLYSLEVFRGIGSVMAWAEYYSAAATRYEHREANGPPAEVHEIEADGPTPGAALLALAARLAQSWQK